MEHGILKGLVSDDTRRDILFKAQLIQNRNDFPQRLWWASRYKSKFEERIVQSRSFVQELLWCLLDPLRQDDTASVLQTVLSHVIGMSDRLEDLQSLHDSLHQSSVAPEIPTEDNGQFSRLASDAKIKAITLMIDTRPCGQTPVLRRAVDLQNLRFVVQST